MLVDNVLTQLEICKSCRWGNPWKRQWRLSLGCCSQVCICCSANWKVLEVPSGWCQRLPQQISVLLFTPCILLPCLSIHPANWLIWCYFILFLLPSKNYKLTIIYWEAKYCLLTTLLRINCSCKNFQLLGGKETIQILRVDSLRRVVIKACAVLLARSRLQGIWIEVR